MTSPCYNTIVLYYARRFKEINLPILLVTCSSPPIFDYSSLCVALLHSCIPFLGLTIAQLRNEIIQIEVNFMRCLWVTLFLLSSLVFFKTAIGYLQDTAVTSLFDLASIMFLITLPYDQAAKS